MNSMQMRGAIEEAYPGTGWKRKVKNMSEAQVVAIYYQFLKSNKLGKPKKKEPKNRVIYEQLRFNI